MQFVCLGYHLARDVKAANIETHSLRSSSNRRGAITAAVVVDSEWLIVIDELQKLNESQTLRIGRIPVHPLRSRPVNFNFFAVIALNFLRGS